MFPPGNLLKDRVRFLFVKTNISFKALSWMTVLRGAIGSCRAQLDSQTSCVN